MFAGHYALGFATKRLEPALSLAVLLTAPQFLDLLWPIFVLAGIEHVEIVPGYTAYTPLAFTHYPWTHSLLMALVWSVVFAAFLRLRKSSVRACVMAGALVLSHWVLDYVSHAPDLPLWPGGPKVGLALWNSVPATLAVETLMFAVGVALYARATRARDRTGRWALFGLVAFFLVIHFSNAFAPPPPSPKAVAIAALALWLIPLWGRWIDRHRTSVISQSAGT
jgi:membrane-bound metal-dependent hydrolase YbcI (DUF457 family)